MANINPGPAQAQTTNTVLDVIAVNTQTNSNPPASNGLRLLASGRAISVNATGDVAVLPVINASRWNVQAVLASNMAVNAGTSVAIEINTSNLGSGTTIVAPQILSGLQAFGGVTVAYRFTVINTTYAGTAQNFYVNCQTTAGTACTLDVFILGYDLS
jgi:hypothetical protein